MQKKLSVVLCRFIWKLSCSVSQSCPRIMFVNRPFTFLYIAWAQKRFSTLGSYLFRNARILFYISMFLINLSINEFWNFIDSKASSWLLGRSGSPVGGVERIEVKGDKNSSGTCGNILPFQPQLWGLGLCMTFLKLRKFLQCLTFSPRDFFPWSSPLPGDWRRLTVS